MKRDNMPYRLHMGCGEGLTGCTPLRQRRALAEEKIQPLRDSQRKTGKDQK